MKLYDDRHMYTIAYAYSGSVPKDAPILPEAAAYRFGATVTPPEIHTPLSDMNFSGWLLNGGPLNETTFPVPARDVTVNGKWSEPPASGDNPPQLPPAPKVVQTLGDNGSAYIIGYEDGTFRPDDFLTAKHEALMLSRLGLPVTPLSANGETLSDTWYITTRREFLNALLDAAGVSVKGPNPMTQAAALGWISGYTDGELYPDAYITKAQAVTIINRAFGRMSVLYGAELISYADVSKDPWAYDAIIAASTVL